MPKISLSTWSLFLKMDYQHAIQFAIENGFQGVEIWSNPFDFLPRKVTPKEIRAIRSIAREHHISLAVHFCFGSNNLADDNEGHLQESIKQLKETIQLCHRIGAEIVIIHPGTVPDIATHEENFLNPQFTLIALKQDSIKRFMKSLALLTLFAEKYQVVIGLENLGYLKNSIQSTFEDLVEWVDQIASPALQITLDVGHANIEDSVEKAIEIFRTRIRHIHLTDNNGISKGKFSDHGELGSGTINWKEIAPFLRSFNGMLSLEVLVPHDIEGGVLRSKSFLENLLKGG